MSEPVPRHQPPPHWHTPLHNLRSQEWQSPASTPSFLSRLPTPQLMGPVPPTAMREAQSQTHSPERTQRAVCLPYPSMSAFTWSQNRWMHSQFSSGILGSVALSYTGGGKKEKTASEREAQGRKRLRPRTATSCFRAFCKTGRNGRRRRSRKQLLLKSA